MNFHPQENSSETAAVIVPALMAMYQPKSVLDLGCNVGWWLYWFSTLGLLHADLHGVDGDNMRENSCLTHEQFAATRSAQDIRSLPVP